MNAQPAPVPLTWVIGLAAGLPRRGRASTAGAETVDTDAADVALASVSPTCLQATVGSLKGAVELGR